jgi:putative flippase GtrA
LQTFLLSPAARPLRFAGTGITAAAVQLGLLTLFTHAGVESLLANTVAFLLAAQVNFALSVTVTWRECLGNGELRTMWATFHGSIAAMALVNLLVFAVAREVMPALVASALGILAGALGNYAAGNTLVFRRRHEAPSLEHAAQPM